MPASKSFTVASAMVSAHEAVLVAARAAAKEEKKKAAKAFKTARHGHEIFFFHHIQTQQVVYSFTKTLQNNESLAQLPFIGKKSKPAALRKDHWAPFATVSFSSNDFGLGIYRKLREFRRLHETCYNESLKREETRRQRKFMVMNQKANSIADLAESIRIEYAEAEQKKEAMEEEIEKKKRRVNKAELARLKELLDTEVIVQWRSILDAEHAADWPATVKHGDQGRADRPYSAPMPKEEGVEVEEQPFIHSEQPKENVITV